YESIETSSTFRETLGLEEEIHKFQKSIEMRRNRPLVPRFDLSSKGIDSYKVFETLKVELSLLDTEFKRCDKKQLSQKKEEECTNEQNLTTDATTSDLNSGNLQSQKQTSPDPIVQRDHVVSESTQVQLSLRHPSIQVSSWDPTRDIIDW